MPQISVVMPVYRVEKYIKASIQSVCDQTFTDYELVITDDGSADNSSAVSDEYASKNTDIVVIHKRNGGLSSARNTGLAVSTGKYVYFIDSDDTLEKFTLEKAYAVSEKTSADITVVGVNVYHIVGEAVKDMTPKERPRLVLNGREIENAFHELVTGAMYNYTWDKLYRRQTIVKNAVFFDSYFDRVCEDTVFLYDLFPYVKKIATVPECCYNYMIRDTQSVVMQYIPERFEKYMARMARIQKTVEGFSVGKEKIEQLILQQYDSSVMWAIKNMFHKDCPLSFFGKYRYYRYMKSLDACARDMSQAVAHLKQNNSGSDILLYKLYRRNQLFLLTVFTQLLLWKQRRNG